MANSHAKAVRTQGISEYSYIYIYLNKYSSVILRAGMRTRGRGISLKSESRRSFWFGINKTAEELRRFARIWSSFVSCRWAPLSTSGALFIGGSEPRAPEKGQEGGRRSLVWRRSDHIASSPSSILVLKGYAYWLCFGKRESDSSLFRYIRVRSLTCLAHLRPLLLVNFEELKLPYLWKILKIPLFLNISKSFLIQNW